MNVWIYDEEAYPSGFAGGLVPEVMPQARAAVCSEEKFGSCGPSTRSWGRSGSAGACRGRDGPWAGAVPPEGRYLLVCVDRAGPGAAGARIAATSICCNPV